MPYSANVKFEFGYFSSEYFFTGYFMNTKIEFANACPGD
jgi:hypothetical protein